MTQNIKQQGLALVQANRLQEAEALYAQLSEQSPADAEVWLLRGTVQGQLGLFAGAEASFRRAIELRPDYAVAHFHLGNTLKLQDKPDEAVKCYRTAIELRPGYVDVLKNLALVLQQQGRLEEALGYLQQALQYEPEYADLRFRAGVLNHQMGGQVAAMDYYRQALSVDPAHRGALMHLGQLCLQREEPVAAEEYYKKLIALNADDGQAHSGLGYAFRRQHRLDEALQSFRRALTIKPDLPEAVAGIAMVLELQGEYKQAYDFVQPFIEQTAVFSGLAIVFAALSGKLGYEEQAVALLERLLKRNGLSDIERKDLHFALARVHDHAGQYDQAFMHFQKGNEAIAPDGLQEGADILSDSIIAVFTPEFFAGAPRAAIDSDRPVFIVGMPRSGTSLVEQIIASHPRAYGAGELVHMINIARSLSAKSAPRAVYPECVPALTQGELDALAKGYISHLEQLASDALCVTDKMPANWWCLGLIALLLPKARVIHCLRDPLDTCLSCYFQDFGVRHTHSRKLRTLGEHYLEYRKVMNHWKNVLTLPMLEVHYEELVKDQERVSRAVIEFTGLEWDPRCLDFHHSKRMVSTASYDQVRQPMYTTSVGRWRLYEKHLGPLKAALGLKS